MSSHFCNKFPGSPTVTKNVMKITIKLRSIEKEGEPNEILIGKVAKQEQLYGHTHTHTHARARAHIPIHKAVMSVMQLVQ